MRIVVVRHGKHEKVPGRNGLLTEGGWASARETGRWLASQGIVPELLVHTPTHRTRQTAEALLEALGTDVPRGKPRTLPRFPARWDKLVDELTQLLSADGDVILVGHHPTQQLAERDFGGAAFGVPPDNRGAAFVIEHTPEARWRCVSVWPGAPNSPAAPTGEG
jgi:phosphohistidine phosphatase